MVWVEVLSFFFFMHFDTHQMFTILTERLTLIGRMLYLKTECLTVIRNNLLGFY
jgi:hypothetical protein